MGGACLSLLLLFHAMFASHFTKVLCCKWLYFSLDMQLLQDMMCPDPSKRPTAQKLARSPLAPAAFSSFTEGNENMGALANPAGKVQISQLMGQGQGSMPGAVKKTASAGSKDSKRKGDAKGSKSAASVPSLTSFLKTTF